MGTLKKLDWSLFLPAANELGQRDVRIRTVCEESKGDNLKLELPFVSSPNLRPVKRYRRGKMPNRQILGRDKQKLGFRCSWKCV